jgi:hypothetical protein
MDEKCKQINHVMKITNDLAKTPSNPSSRTALNTTTEPKHKLLDPQHRLAYPRRQSQPVTTTNQFALLTQAQHTTAYPDTAATGHFVPTNCPGKAVEHTQLNVQCANNTHMQSTATIELNLPTLPPALKTATVFKEMTKPLFSVPVLCDGNMEVTFRKTDMSKTKTTTLSSRASVTPPHHYGSSQLCNKKYAIYSNLKQCKMSPHSSILPTVRTTSKHYPN